MFRQFQTTPVTTILAAFACYGLFTGCQDVGNIDSNNQPNSPATQSEVAKKKHPATHQASKDKKEQKKQKKHKAGPKERNVDIAVMEWRGQDIGEGNRRPDVDKKAPFKITVFQDKGHETVNRVKVDLERNGVWDEGWAFRGAHGKILLKKDPAPDGKFRKIYEWHKGSWKKISQPK